MGSRDTRPGTLVAAPGDIFIANIAVECQEVDDRRVMRRAMGGGV